MSQPRMWPEQYAHIDSAGKPYRPANGTEGEIFEHLWCSRCHYYPNCRIMSRAFIFGIGDREYPGEWRISIEGQPECTAFEEPRPRKPRGPRKPAKGQMGLPI